MEHLADWRKRNDASPCGGGALTGNTLGLDPELVARELGLANVCQNSIDGTASRDGAVEFLYILTQIAVDMSRPAEEIVIWNTIEFNYVTLDDAYSTGPGITPQKKNPDIAEPACGKAGRLIGDLTGLLAMLKSSPLAYDRDLQGDKEPVLDAIDIPGALLPAAAGMVETMHLRYDRIEALSVAGFSLMTDVAEWLVKQGMPFQRVHEVSGAHMTLAESRGYGLKGLSDADFTGVSSASISEACDVLSASSVVSVWRGMGGTASARVAEQISAAWVRLEWLSA